MLGNNPAFLMNDPVDELVGAAEEVVMSSTHFFLALIVPRTKGL
jgi:hypothetical protein